MKKILIVSFILILMTSTLAYAFNSSDENSSFPRSQESYNDEDYDNIWDIIKYRIRTEHFNAAATLIFFMAITHTMMTGVFKKKLIKLKKHMNN